MFEFFEVLSDVVKFGNIFEIAGASASAAKDIKIFLSSGVSKDQDSVLSITLNCETNKITLNKNFVFNIPLRSDAHFEIRILVGTDRFYIAYNGTAVGECGFDKSLEAIRSVIVFGDIRKLTKVNHVNVFPTSFPKIAIDDEFLAFESYIPNKFSPGHLIVISAICDEQFYVSFTQNGTNRELIHFNPRFDENAVVLNTEDYVDGWQEELRPEIFPFEIGKPFKIAFAFSREELKIAVDGCKLADFEYDRIYLEDDETLWEILSGFRIKNRNADTTTTVLSVEHIKIESDCNDFEKYSVL